MESLPLTRVLQFKPNFRVEAVDAHTIFLVSERQRVVLANPNIARVAMLVDGRRDVREILQASQPSVSEAQALYAMCQLADRGYLIPASSMGESPAAAFWHDVGLDFETTAERLSRRPVSVLSLATSEMAHRMTEALEGAGVRCAKESFMTVVVTDDYLRPELAAINEAALLCAKPWCLVKTIGSRPLLGPVLSPPHTACWECLAFWLRNGRPVEELLRRIGAAPERTNLPAAGLDATVRTASGFAALAIARVLASDPAFPEGAIGGQLLELDLAALRTIPHAVVRRPQCPACGDARLMASVGERPIELREVQRTHCSDGGYRQRTPRETFARYQHLISPVTGAVTHVVPIPARDTELRSVFASGYLVCPSTGVPDKNVFDKVCAGKGRTREQAKTSALCEALERFSGVYQGDEARVRASRAELGSAAFSPAELLNFSDAQYRQPQPQQRVQDVREWVPQPLDSDTPIDWTLGWSLTRNERRYVPLSYCYSETPDASGTAYCRSNGNGVAAGNCLEEATLHGLLELVERDAVGIWWYNRLSRPGVDLGSFQDSYFDALETDYARLGWRLWALDLTHDLSIPTIVALAHQPEADRWAIGFGSHLEPHLAVQRALTELNQLFEPVGKRRAPWDCDRLTDREYLFPNPQLPVVTAGDFPRLGGQELSADIRECQKRLEAAGLELTLIDKSRPDIGLSVVQVVVPGLRHFGLDLPPAGCTRCPARWAGSRSPTKNAT